MTKFEKPGRRMVQEGDAERPWDYPDMARESGTKALADAGLPYDKIEQAVVGHVDGEAPSRPRAPHAPGITGLPGPNGNNHWPNRPAGPPHAAPRTNGRPAPA